MATESAKRIRKPGEPFELTDDELLTAPVRMLTPEQRRRRRQLRNNIAKENTRARRRARKNGTATNRRGQPVSIAKIKQCQGKRKDGEDCEAFALTGAKHCAAHVTDEEKERLGVIDPDRSQGGRPKIRANAPQLMREVAEAAVAKVIAPVFQAIGAEFVGFDEDGQPVVRDLGPEAGLMLYGESKDGEIIMTSYPDLGGRIQAAEKLLDRVYGKPKQTQVLEGGTKPIQIQPVRTVERSQAVASILQSVGAVGGAIPAGLPASTVTDTVETGGDVLEGRVVPIKPDPKPD